MPRRENFSRVTLPVAGTPAEMICAVNCAHCHSRFDRGYRICRSRAARPQFCSEPCRTGYMTAKADARRLGRFWAKVATGHKGECWPWKAQCDAKGYGKFQMRAGEPWLAHRASYLFANDCDPGQHAVCHSCDNPPCCNPGHLWLGDAKANVADMIAKGRKAPLKIMRGSESKSARLTAEQALAIVGSDETNKVLASRYGVTDAAIYNVRHGKAWAHVTGVSRG